MSKKKIGDRRDGTRLKSSGFEKIWKVPRKEVYYSAGELFDKLHQKV